MYIQSISHLIYNSTKSHNKKFVCPYCTCTYFNSQDALTNHLDKKHPYINNEFMCEKCLNVFHTAEAKEFHDSICMVKESEPRVVKYPAYNKPIQWEEKDNYKLNRIPTWFVADFECVLMKEEQLKGMNTKIIHKHQPCAWVLTVVIERKGALYNKTFMKVAQSAEEAMETFMHKILEVARLVYQHEQMLVPMEKLEGMKRGMFETATRCYICHDPFKGFVKRKVADHDHVTGKFLGAACNTCNLKRQSHRFFIPLLFHNARGYDMHQLIQEVTKLKYRCEFEGIPNSREKFLSFMIIPPVEACPIRIIDSLQFLPVSLSSLVETQKKEFTDQSKAFPLFFHLFCILGYDDEQINFLLKKNKFPYEWLDSFEKLNARSWDMLMKTYLNFAWLHTPHVWQYLQLYLICDVVQLADI